MTPWSYLDRSEISNHLFAPQSVSHFARLTRTGQSRILLPWMPARSDWGKGRPESVADSNSRGRGDPHLPISARLLTEEVRNTPHIRS